MKTFEIVMMEEVNEDVVEVKHYIKTDAEEEQVKQSVQFVGMGSEPTVDKLLQALRTLGAKATQIKIDPIASFEM